ncbi:NADH-quinone oxidoreductase subunit B family protein [Methanosarcina sp.]|nr:NADH-quinone oxidoreductase subunit B family protein [Methanosarcina sp.]MDW5559269.1 NADH-quinone oxidoreductase subunit B family protein [Methanosarcina sp.]
MVNPLTYVFRPKVTEKFEFSDSELETLGSELKTKVNRVFGHSLAIRELDSGSDNSAEIEISNLAGPHYDIERFGIYFVASPRHADVLLVTGAVTLNMAEAVLKTYEAMPSPKFVVAVGDDACDGGIYKGSYAVLGGVDKILPVDIKIPGNPPSPKEILRGIFSLVKKV